MSPGTGLLRQHLDYGATGFAACDVRVTIVTGRKYHGTMKTLTIRDFRTRPREAQRMLKIEGEAILTSNGKPVAVMVGVDAESLDEALQTLRRARGLRALRGLRKDARLAGSGKLAVREIDSLVTKVRRERRRRS